MYSIDLRIAASDLARAAGKDLGDLAAADATSETIAETVQRMRSYAAALDALIAVLPTRAQLSAEQQELEAAASRCRESQAATSTETPQ